MNQNYLVLARKYRPINFSELKGQSFLVKTLVNAIKLDRVAHAFLLTGIRGGGKTTTARIIAKTLNCTDRIITDELVLPCEKCLNCMSGKKHPDIMELDAASRTSVDDMREIIESVNYTPMLGKFKIYIIDEVHMLSTNAFNALLKTLEEPPSHVKFIFATTELRKIPLTILSRCQKFTLRRLNENELVEHLNFVLSQENIKAENSALELIAIHADGSVRDSLSLLDTVIASANGQLISREFVKDLFGYSDFSQIISLISNIFKGDAHNCLKQVEEFYYAGKDLLNILQQMLEMTLSLSKVLANIPLNNFEYSAQEREEIELLAKNSEISALTILWQLISSAIEELKFANNQLIAIEMIMIRLCYASQLPTPNSMINLIENNIDKSGTSGLATQINQDKKKVIDSFEELVKIFYQQREMLLYHYLTEDVHLVEFSKFSLRFRQKSNVPHNFANKVANFLHEYTGEKWKISVTADLGEPTLSDKATASRQNELDELKEHEIVQEVLKNFAEAEIKEVN